MDVKVNDIVDFSNLIYVQPYHKKKKRRNKLRNYLTTFLLKRQKITITRIFVESLFIHIQYGFCVKVYNMGDDFGTPSITLSTHFL